MSNFEVRANIKFMTKLEWKPNEIIEALQRVYGDSSPSRTTVYDWIKRFKDGREQLEDDPRRGRPCTAKNEKNIKLVQDLVQQDCRITLDEIVNEVGISRGSAFSILSGDLGLSKLLTRWVPKELREDQMLQRADLSFALLTRIEADEVNFFEQCVTGDETWIYQYDPESKIQSEQPLPGVSAEPVKSKAKRPVQKVVVTVFWDSKGVILIDFLVGHRTVTATYYEGIIRKLKSALIQKRSEKLHHQIIFHHESARAHSANNVKAVLREFQWETFPHPPYSPDLAPSDFFLFPKMNEHLQGTRFETIEEAQQEVLTWCSNQPPEFFLEGIFRWKHRLQTCIDLNGGYVEK